VRSASRSHAAEQPRADDAGLTCGEPEADTYSNSAIHLNNRFHRSYDQAMAIAVAPQTISIKDAAVRLGVHENTVRAWFDSGILEGYVSPTGRRKVRLDSVERHAQQMFGVPTGVVELGDATTPPPQRGEPQRAQDRLP